MSDSLLFAPPLQLHHHHHHHYSSRHRSPPPSLAPPSPSLSLSLSISSPPPRPQKDAIFAGAFTDLNKDSSLNNEGGGVDGDAPTSLDLVPITTEEQFDRIIAEAQQLEEPLIILWMANWCRKCIYLKPKLEKLAADYYPGIRFYCVDVNTVPQRLVTRAGITKMPTIQLWRDSEKQAEVIGGQNKAWLVIDDVRRMIENDN